MAENDKNTEVIISNMDSIEVDLNNIQYIPNYKPDGKTTRLNSETSRLEAIGLTDGEDVITYNQIKDVIDKRENKSFVFDTKAHFLAWLSGSYVRQDGELPSNLEIGDDILIEEASVPDYWVKSKSNPMTISDFAEYESKQDYYTKSEIDSKVETINNSIATKQDTLTFDSTPTESSSNPVTSDGIKTYVDNSISHIDLTSKQDKTDNSLETTSKTVAGAINEVNSIAKGRVYAKSYNDISAMVTALNAMSATDLKVGDNLYIVVEDVPDLWIGKVESTSSTYTYTTDSAFITALTGDLTTTVQVGYYRLCKLESEKVDLTNCVTTDTAQTITAIKTFDNQVTFSNSSAAGTNNLTIKNDNGYNAKIKMGSTENMRLMTGGTFFGATVGVTTDNAYDLGASGTAWKDFYLKGKIALDNYIIDKDGFGQLQIRNANTTSLQIDGGTVRSQNIVPMANNQKDLGSSSMQWRDIYLGGVLNVIKSGVSGDAKWHIEEDQYGQLVVSRTYNDVKSGMIQFNGNSIKPVGANGNLGSASQQWKDLYLSGNLSDGTNSISVAQILTSGAFKSLNLTSTTLSADELLTIQNYNVVLQSDITLGSGTTLHAQTILTKPFSYSNTLRGLYIDNSKVGTYLIDTNTNTLGQGAQDIVLNGVAQINSKAIPSYPNDNNTYYLEYVNGTLTWVRDNTVKKNTSLFLTARVYGQSIGGNEQMYQISPNIFGNFLVQRDSDGMFNVNEPIQGTHPASKNYVDTAIASAITTALNTPV